MKFKAKYIRTLTVLIALFLLYFIIIKGASEKEYECYGMLETQYGVESQYIYLRLTKYGISANDSWGDAWFEVPSTIVRSYSYIRKMTRDQLHIYYSSGDQEFMGIFSLLSNHISINLGIGYFEGKCEEIYREL